MISTLKRSSTCFSGASVTEWMQHGYSQQAGSCFHCTQEQQCATATPCDCCSCACCSTRCCQFAASLLLTGPPPCALTHPCCCCCCYWYCCCRHCSGGAFGSGTRVYRHFGGVHPAAAAAAARRAAAGAGAQPSREEQQRSALLGLMQVCACACVCTCVQQHRLCPPYVCPFLATGACYSVLIVLPSTFFPPFAPLI